MGSHTTSSSDFGRHSPILFTDTSKLGKAIVHVVVHIERSCFHLTPTERHNTLRALSSVCKELRRRLLPYVFQSITVRNPTSTSLDIRHPSFHSVRPNVRHLTLSGVLFSRDAFAALYELASLSALSLLNVTISFPPETRTNLPKSLNLVAITVTSPQGTVEDLDTLVAGIVTQSVCSITTNDGVFVSCLERQNPDGCPRLESLTFHLADSDAPPPRLSQLLQHPVCESLQHLEIIGEIRPPTELLDSHLSKLSTLISPASWATALTPGRPIRRLHILPSYNPSAEAMRRAIEASLVDMVDLSVPARVCTSQFSGSLFGLERLSQLRCLQVYTTLSLARERADQCRTSFGLAQQATEYWAKVSNAIKACRLDRVEHVSLRLSHVHGSVSYHLQAQLDALQRLFTQATLLSVDFTEGVIWNRYQDTWVPWIEGAQRSKVKAGVTDILQAKGAKAHMLIISDVGDCLWELFEGEDATRAMLARYRRG